MNTIASIRSEIDAIDDQIVDLYTRRLAASTRIAEAKKGSGAPIFAPAREREIVTRLAEKAGPEMASDVAYLYDTVFAVSRARQRALLGGDAPLCAEIRSAAKSTPAAFPEMATVACQGADGAYSQQALSSIFRVPTILFFNSFEDVFNAVEKGMCRYGILPVENSLAGSVTAVYDLMVRHHFRIVRAFRQKITHALLAPMGVALADIREVMSHSQALSQCSDFLNAHKAMKTTAASNTAVAARDVAASPRRDLAVIASRACAELYGLSVVEGNVSNTPHNFTRFICISKDLEIYPDARKISIMMSLPHRPGSLSNILSRFSSVGVNLTKLESRPVPGMDFEFMFTFDFEADPMSPSVQSLLAELSTDPEIERFTFLGAYAEK